MSALKVCQPNYNIGNWKFQLSNQWWFSCKFAVLFLFNTAFPQSATDITSSKCDNLPSQFKVFRWNFHVKHHHRKDDYPVFVFRNLITEVQMLSWPSSGPEFCIIWSWKMPASGWRSLWESSSFVPWLVLNAFRDVSGAVPEWPWFSGLMRKSSRSANAPSMQFSVLLNSCDNFFGLSPRIPQKLELCSLLGIWEHSSFVPYCS